jgi:hypothetical protein
MICLSRRCVSWGICGLGGAFRPNSGAICSVYSDLPLITRSRPIAMPLEGISNISRRPFGRVVSTGNLSPKVRLKCRRNRIEHVPLPLEETMEDSSYGLGKRRFAPTKRK